MITHLASDSKLYQNGPFKACLGSCITVGNIEEFNKKYDEIMDNLFEESQTPKDRICYKSYDFAKLFTTKLTEKLEEFLIEISKIDNFQFAILTTSFNTKKTPEVKLYTRNSKNINTLNFLDMLSQYYNYICVWKISKLWQLGKCEVFLDNFTGEITEAWEELNHHHTIRVIFEGDQCNRMISTSDLITRYFEEKSKKEHIKIHEDNIIEMIKELEIEDGNSYYIGPQDFEYIVPTQKHLINLKDYYINPTIYVLKEGIIDAERTWIGYSQFYNKLLTFTCKKEGSLKFIDSDQDPRFIRNGDYLIYLGEGGKRQAHYLVAILGYPVTVLQMKDIY